MATLSNLVDSYVLGHIKQRPDKYLKVKQVSGLRDTFTNIDNKYTQECSAMIDR